MSAALRRWPLHVLVLLALLIITGLAMLVAGNMVRNRTTDYLHATLERHSQIMLSALAGASLDATISTDIPVLATVVSEAGQRDADIVLVAIYTRDRHELASWRRPTPVAPGNVAKYEQAISLEGETFGFIRIDWDITAQRQAIETHVRQIHLIVMMALVATIVVVLVLLGGLALRPLAIIRSTLLDLSDHKARAALGGVRTSREIDQIITAVHALATAQDKLTAARDRAEAASRAKSEFLAVMGHELRTPLHCMMGMAELLSMTDLDVQQKEYLESVLSASRGLNEVLAAVLQYTSIDPDAKPEMSTYDLSAILEQQLARIKADAEKKGISLALVLPPSLPVMEGDEKALTQILKILLGNAVKFSPAGRIQATVTISRLDQRECDLEIQIIDSGIGIPADKLDAIFEPFHQVDNSATRNYEGIGLGLAIARQLANKLRGKLWVDSVEGEGSIFHLQLTQAVAAPLNEAGMQAPSGVTSPAPHLTTD